MKLFKYPVYLITVLFYLTSCSNQVIFQTSEILPAAEGKVKVTERDNGNYLVEMSVEYLADPDDLKPSRKYYVVWSESKEGTFNLGELMYQKSKKGSLEAESTYKPKFIIITAEDEKKPKKPGKQVVLRSKKL